MYILLSCAISLDGYLDDASDERLVLSNAADLDRVDAVRAGVDAILVGANTVRNDNPRLSVRSPARRAAREAAGKPADTAEGDPLVAGRAGGRGLPRGRRVRWSSTARWTLSRRSWRPAASNGSWSRAAAGC